MSSQVATTRPTTARPRTGQSRPATARPQTAASVRHEGSYVIAVFEGRGVAREVGMAAIDRETGKVMLVQVNLYFTDVVGRLDQFLTRF
jgi:DNA mismatch repair protein MSH4